MREKLPAIAKNPVDRNIGEIMQILYCKAKKQGMEIDFLNQDCKLLQVASVGHNILLCR